MSPNNPPFFKNTSSKVDYILETFLNNEVDILGDFNVHNLNRLKYLTHNDAAG